MSQQPSRIIRRVPTPSRRASAGDLATATPASDPDVCLACGARIADVNQHADFHAGINTVMRWMQGVTELLGEPSLNLQATPQTREQLPTQGDSTPNAGDTDPAPTPRSHPHA
ncbi:hypothetical protein [Nocardia sp. NPDC051463]|uniref:hypothetical protein n=1 Tax=Nocardia sp. NPDC051463 TaxID=3154845 RepID=UPI0034509E98